MNYRIKQYGIDYLRFFCGLIFIILCSTRSGIAQNTSFEFWPETDVWYALNPAWRLSAFVPLTKYHESTHRDLNIYLQAEYKWGKVKHSIHMRQVDENRQEAMKGWMVRGGFMEGWSLGEYAGEYTEDMLFAELHKRIPLLGSLLLSQRLRMETRWVGQDPDFSYRIRYRVMLEKEFDVGKSSIVPYWNIEPYWDSRYSSVSRLRVIGGVTASWGGRFAYEGNLTYQYDSHYSTANLWALNIILHVYFETKHTNPE